MRSHFNPARRSEATDRARRLASKRRRRQARAACRAWETAPFESRRAGHHFAR